MTHSEVLIIHASYHCKSELYCFVMQHDSNCWLVCEIMLSCITLPKSFIQNVGILRIAMNITPNKSQDMQISITSET